MGQTKLQALFATLSHLARLLRDSGNDEAANSVQDVLKSPTDIAAIHKTLSSHLQNLKKDDENLSSQRSWFRKFKPRDGSGLSETQIHKLTTLTKNWALSENKIAAFLSCSILWINHPALFWEGGRQGNNLLRRCFDDLEQLEEIAPLKRRIILITLSKRVEQERKKISTQGKRQRSSKKLKENVQRTRPRLSTSLESIVRETWPDAGVRKQAEIKASLARHSHYGWKWQQISPLGSLLSIPTSSTRSIERNAWKVVELEALNEFLQTLPQYRIQVHLQKALEKLSSYYHNRPSFAISLIENHCGADSPILIDELGPQIRIPSPGSNESSCVTESDQDSALRLSNQSGFDSPSENGQTAQSLLVTPATLSGEDEGNQLTLDVISESSNRSPQVEYSGRATRTEPGIGNSEFSWSLPISYQSEQQDSYFSTNQQMTVSGYDHISPMNQTQNFDAFNDTSFAMQGFSDTYPASLNTQQTNDTSVAMQWFISNGRSFDPSQSCPYPLGLSAPEDPLYGNLSQADYESTPRFLNDTSVAMSGFASHE